LPRVLDGWLNDGSADNNVRDDIEASPSIDPGFTIKGPPGDLIDPGFAIRQPSTGLLSVLPAQNATSGLHLFMEPHEIAAVPGLPAAVSGNVGAPSKTAPITMDQVDPNELAISWAPGTEPMRKVLERIAIGEGTSDSTAKAHHYDSGYDVAYGNRPTQKPISQMTLDEVDQLQGQMGEHTPIGKYQITQKTLDDLRNNFQLNGNRVFGPDLQDRMARRLLEQRGFNNYVDGKIGGQQLEHALAPEWGSLEDPVTGKAYNGYAPATTLAQFQGALSQVPRRK
jgi:muramidase (phage lysozyme)